MSRTPRARVNQAIGNLCTVFDARVGRGNSGKLGRESGEMRKHLKTEAGESRREEAEPRFRHEAIV